MVCKIAVGLIDIIHNASGNRYFNLIRIETKGTNGFHYGIRIVNMPDTQFSYGLKDCIMFFQSSHASFSAKLTYYPTHPCL